MWIFDRFMTVDLLQRFMGVHDLMAMHYRDVAAKTGIQTFDQLSQQHLKLVGLYKEMGDEMQKQGRNKKRGWILIGMLVVMLLLLPTGSVGAQDEPSPLTPLPQGEGNIETPGLVIPDTSESSPLVLVLMFGFTLLVATLMALQQRNIGVLLATVSNSLKDKRIQDEAERGYMESSLSIQQTITLLEAMAKFVGGMNLPGVDKLVDDAGEFLETITDGKPNLTAEDIQAIRRRAVPPPPLDFPPPQFPTGG